MKNGENKREMYTLFNIKIGEMDELCAIIRGITQQPFELLIFLEAKITHVKLEAVKIGQYPSSIYFLIYIHEEYSMAVNCKKTVLKQEQSKNHSWTIGLWGTIRYTILSSSLQAH